MTDNPNPGGYEGGEAPSDASGMTPDDATESAFNDWDEKTHGISEASRTEWGPQLKTMADHEGTNVRDGVNALVSSHINKRYGSNEIKRQAILSDIDAYQINAVPTVEAEPQAVEHVNPEADTGAVPSMDAIQGFIQANPIADDAAIHASMIEIAADMRRQGYAPDLSTMLNHAIKNDPRYNEQARQAYDADQVARARAADVQVTGGGRSTGAGVQSSDVGDILDELVPR